MKYPSDSAIQNHYLESILPHPTRPQPKQFLKNKEFYKPEKFIWNNPHRASNQMFKFYHAYNEQYLKYKEPLLRKLEERDREEAEANRIHRLIAFRSKARQEFLEKQRSREVLESKVRNQSIPITSGGHTEADMLSLETKYKSQSNNDKRKRKHQHAPTRKLAHSQRLEDSYRVGVKKYDARVEEISKLIGSQNEQFHSKIRQEFALRKKINEESSSKFYGKRESEGAD